MKYISYLFLFIILSSCNDNAYQNNYLVDINTVDKSIIINLKYATDNNFLNKKIYQDNKTNAKLVSQAANSLKQAQQEFVKRGYSLKVWDAYRPISAQKIMWEIMPDPRYVSNPKQGGRHTRGTAVDVTLVDLKTGNEIKMPTKFDDFSTAAHRNFALIKDPKIKANVILLEQVMHKNGFVGLATEWWHFDYKNWQDYPVITK